jgi:aryl-alcohol dehydrogenase-like predicted oxidoreductase
MRYKLLGTSGMRVSELALGTMTFGEDWGWGASKDESRRIFDRFAEAGGNFVDTSNNYTNGTSETFVGEFLSSDRDHFVLATKFSLSKRPDDPNAGGNHPKNIVQALEGSLRHLQTDRVDLYWLHMWDFTTPVEDIMYALDTQVRAGKVLHVGFSDTPAWVVSRAHAVAEVRGWAKPVAIQLPYGLADRDPERELLPMARQLGLAVTPWGVLSGGVLTGKYSDGSTEPKRYGEDPQSERELQLAKEIRAVADEVGRSPAQIAINWVRAQDRGTIVPILGARTEQQLEDDLACLEFELSGEHLERLDEASRIRLGFPLDFLGSNGVQHLIFGETGESIDRAYVPPRP